MIAIFKREFRSYFHSMIGYVFLAFMLCFIGIYFIMANVLSGYPFVGAILPNVIFIFMFAFPILTMRSMSEERHTKTDQLLLTSPITVPQMVLGKFFGMAAVYGICCLATAILPLIMLMMPYHQTVVDYGCLLAFFLLGCVYIAIGMFISALTESQFIAAVLSIVCFLVMYLAPSLVSFVPNTAAGSFGAFIVIITVIAVIYLIQSRNLYVSLIIEAVGVVAIGLLYRFKTDAFDGLIQKIVNELTLMNPIEMFCGYAMFDLSGIVYYLSLIIFFVVLTVLAVQKRRWN